MYMPWIRVRGLEKRCAPTETYELEYCCCRVVLCEPENIMCAYVLCEPRGSVLPYQDARQAAVSTAVDTGLVDAYIHDKKYRVRCGYIHAHKVLRAVIRM